MLINPYGLFSSLLLTAIFLSSPPKFIQVQLTLAMVGLSGRRVANYFETEEEAFHACIYDGDYQPLRGLLLDTSTSRNLNRPIFDFGPPLHFAAFCGDLVSVEPLLGAGADTHFSGRDMVKRLWRCGNSEKKKKRARATALEHTLSYGRGRGTRRHCGGFVGLLGGLVRGCKDASALVGCATVALERGLFTNGPVYFRTIEIMSMWEVNGSILL